MTKGNLERIYNAIIVSKNDKEFLDDLYLYLKEIITNHNDIVQELEKDTEEFDSWDNLKWVYIVRTPEEVERKNEENDININIYLPAYRQNKLGFFTRDNLLPYTKSLHNYLMSEIDKAKEQSGEQVEEDKTLEKNKNESEDFNLKVEFRAEENVMINDGKYLYQIKTLHYLKRNYQFFKYMYKNPNTDINISDLKKEGIDTDNDHLSDIVSECGFTGDLRKAFFSTAKDVVKFTNPIQNPDKNFIDKIKEQLGEIKNKEKI